MGEILLTGGPLHNLRVPSARLVGDEVIVDDPRSGRAAVYRMTDHEGGTATFACYADERTGRLTGTAIRKPKG